MAGKLTETLEDLEQFSNLRDLVRVLVVVASKMQTLEGDARKITLTEAELDTVLHELTSRGIWGPKNQKTLEGMVSNGSGRHEAFATLTDGSAAVRGVVDMVLASEPFTVTPDPKTPEKTEPDPVVEPEPTAEDAPPKRRGRPRRDS